MSPQTQLMVNVPYTMELYLFFYNDLVSSPDDIQLFTNAAPSVSFGGFYQGSWFASSWPPQLLDAPQSSALFELYPLVVAAFLWGKDWSANSILVHCDNEAAVHCINKARSNSPALMPLLRHLIWISASNQFIITAKHVLDQKIKLLTLFLVLCFRDSDRWLQSRTHLQPQFLTIHNSSSHKSPLKYPPQRVTRFNPPNSFTQNHSIISNCLEML